MHESDVAKIAMSKWILDGGSGCVVAENRKSRDDLVDSGPSGGIRGPAALDKLPERIGHIYAVAHCHRTCWALAVDDAQDCGTFDFVERDTEREKLRRRLEYEPIAAG